jgi:hypothetical protein
MDFIPMPTDFQFNKLLFFKESNYNEVTRRTYWGLYLNYIADLEEEYNIDLYYFSQKEINYYLDNIKNKSQQTIFQANSFINKYLKWYGKKYYNNGSEKHFDLTIKKEIDKSWYISKRDFYKMCNNMLKVSNKNFPHITPLLFARYGITGKELIYMRNVKWKDIDYNKKLVFIYNKDRKEKLLSVPVDNMFLKWIKNLEQYNDERYKDIDVINKHIITTQISEDIIVNYSSINTKSFNCFKAINVKRISFKTLFNCAIVDYIKEIYSNFVPRSNDEIKECLTLYYPEENIDVTKLKTIKTLYGEVFDDNKTLRTYGRVKSKKLPKKIKRSDISYKSENNDTDLKQSKDILKDEIIIEENYAYIIIKRATKNEKVKIDKEIIDKIKDYKWYLNSSGYVVARKRIKERLAIIHLSNFILNKNEYFHIKHLNGDKLDCTIKNLEKS